MPANRLRRPSRIGFAERHNPSPASRGGFGSKLSLAPKDLLQMSDFTRQLAHLGNTLRGQLKQLTSGETKVLQLLDGGSSDVDDTDSYVAQLRSCLQSISLIAEQVVESQGMSLALAPLLRRQYAEVTTLRVGSERVTQPAQVPAHRTWSFP
jgi:hypothetical protein